MPYQLTGILKLPDGTPAANVDIEFISQANYSPLVRDLSNTIRTSATGSYSVALEYGEYAIRLLYASAYPLHPGKIYVYADTPAGQDLPTLMQAASSSPTTPDYVVQIQNWLIEAKAARDAAAASAAAAKVSESAVAGSITQHEAKAGAHSISGVAGLQAALDAKLGVTATAAAATKLATARTIGGESFDGTANINLPGVNVAGNQPTSGNAATATKLATARTLTIGNTGKTFDGSANQSWSLADIGALPLTGGTLTGTLTLTQNSNPLVLSAAAGGYNIIQGNIGGTRAWWIGRGSTTNNDITIYSDEVSGLIKIRTADVQVNKNFVSDVDNGRSIGTAASRWSTVYAGTGTINTSDAREKTAVTPLNDAEIAAAIDICNNIGTYQWLESIENKTEDVARHHVGLTVQRAIEIMEEYGLNPFRYGFICYDKWEAEYQDVDDEAGDLVRTVERQVTRAEERTTTEIKVVDGVPTQVTTVTTEQVPVYEDKAVVDETGNPILVNHPAELDEDGGIIREAYSTALTHPVPVMESVEVRYRRDVVREAGDRYSFRMDQLALFCLCGIAQSS